MGQRQKVEVVEIYEDCDLFQMCTSTPTKKVVGILRHLLEATSANEIMWRARMDSEINF